MNTLYIECAQRALLYKSIWTDRSIDAYFNAHKLAPTLIPNIFPRGISIQQPPGLRTNPAYVELVSQQYLYQKII